MGEILHEPGDTGRSTRSHANTPTDYDAPIDFGKSRQGFEEPDDLDDLEKMPSFVVIAAVVVVFVVGLTNFALGQIGLGVAVVSVGLLVFGGGLSWLAMERRRVRQAEREWLINHPARR